MGAALSPERPVQAAHSLHGGAAAAPAAVRPPPSDRERGASRRPAVRPIPTASSVDKRRRLTAMAEQLDFEDAWQQLVARAWSDPALKAKLLADPAGVLKAEGLIVPA